MWEGGERKREGGTEGWEGEGMEEGYLRKSNVLGKKILKRSKTCVI